jgi:hypothetical protein
MGPDAVTDSEDRVEVVMVDEPRNLFLSFALNYSEFPNSCRRVELPLLEDVSKVLVDRRNGDLVQLSQKALGQPNRPAIEAHLDTAPTVLPLVEDDFGGRGSSGLVYLHDFAASRRHPWYPD